jgi:hypothetical protein
MYKIVTYKAQGGEAKEQNGEGQEPGEPAAGAPDAGQLGLCILLHVKFSVCMYVTTTRRAKHASIHTHTFTMYVKTYLEQLHRVVDRVGVEDLVVVVLLLLQLVTVTVLFMVCI